MTATGGSIIEMTINGRPFGVESEADVGMMLQQYQNEVKMNGNGSLRLLRKLVAQVLESIVLSIDGGLGDFEFINEVNDSGILFDLTMGLADGRILAGKGQFVGEIKEQSQESTAEVTINGTGITPQ